MISKKNLTTIHKSATLFVVFMLVFGANIASAQNYTDPAGPPPGNNAPAPIHEGTLGQGKYWNPSLIPSYSIGAMLGIFEGLLSEWIIADGAGVAATQFCLGTADEIDGAGFHEDGSTTGLNCVTDATGWPVGGGDGGGGDGGDGGDGTSSSIPDGDIWHQLLYYSNQTSSWRPLPLTQVWTPLEQYLAGSTSVVDVIDAGLPLPGPSIEFGSLDQLPYEYDPAEIPASGDAYFPGAVSMTVTGSFLAQNETSGGPINYLSVGGSGARINGPFRIQHVTGETVPINNILANTTANGQTDWKTADDLGLVTDSELITAINNIVFPSSTIPDGTSSGQILWWNEVADVWQASALGGYLEGLGFTVNNNGGGGFNIIDSMGTCPVNAGLKVKPGIFSNMRVIDCATQILITPALMTLSSTSTLISSSNEFKVTSPNAVFTKLVHNAPEPRPVCAETDGDLTLCGNQSTGTWTQSTNGSYTFTVPSGVYELTYSLRGAGGAGGGGGFGKALYAMDLDNNNPVFSKNAMAGGGGGAGGGKGEFINGVMDVFPGQQILVNVGFGGTGGCAISYAGGTTCHPYGNSTGGQMNGSTGQNGADSIINGPAAGQDFTAEGGNGGEGGASFNPNMSNPASALELGTATPGGEGGTDWDGDINSGDGDFGQIRHEYSGQNVIDDSNYDGGAPDHPNPIGAGNSNTGSCLRQNTIAYGGDGGEGSGGTPGGGGGNAYTHGSFEPSTCDLDSNSYLTIGAGAWGDNGGDATDGTGNGGGGAGGGSSIAAPYSWTDTGTAYVGKGGIGGDGGDGYVYFSW